jgi:hypothetical protein
MIYAKVVNFKEGYISKPKGSVLGVIPDRMGY